MKAVRVTEHGGPEVLSYDELPVPEPAENEAIVKVDASGVNFIDIYFRTGLYPADPPFINGQEGAGTVTAVGSRVRNVRVGDRVAWTGIRGSYSEYANVIAERLVPVPQGIETRQAAGIMLQGMTVHYLTHSTFPLQPGQTALVHAAAGGVGLLLVQVAKMMGANVIGTCSTEEKAKRVEAAGADLVIRYTEQDFEKETKLFTNGKGVDVVYDSVGKSTFEGSLNSLKPRGMMVTFGNASGPVAPVEPLTLTKHGSLFLTRPSLFAYIATRGELLYRARDVFGWISSEKIKLTVGEEHPLRDAALAQERLAGRLTTGKILLIPEHED